MINKLRYFIKRKNDLSFIDMEVEYLGLIVLGFDGFNTVGKPTNISTQKWINSNIVDVYIPETIYREANEVELTFMFADHLIDCDIQAEHNRFIDDLTNNKFSLRTGYLYVDNNFICTSEYTPSQTNIQQTKGMNSIVGTIKLQKLNSLNELGNYPILLNVIESKNVLASMVELTLDNGEVLPFNFVGTQQQSIRIVATRTINNVRLLLLPNVEAYFSAAEKTNTSGVQEEYLNYANIASVFDKFGVGIYLLSFDLKSAVAGSIGVYLLGTAGIKRYTFTDISIYAATEYQHFSIPIDVQLYNPDSNEAKLSFYGTYGTGRIPTVKNVRLQRYPIDVYSAAVTVKSLPDLEINQSDAALPLPIDKNYVPNPLININGSNEIEIQIVPIGPDYTFLFSLNNSDVLSQTVDVIAGSYTIDIISIRGDVFYPYATSNVQAEWLAIVSVTSIAASNILRYTFSVLANTDLARTGTIEFKQTISNKVVTLTVNQEAGIINVNPFVVKADDGVDDHVIEGITYIKKE